ncbi:hypothetical protein LNQ49_00035 [Flavobacterium sp. F-65]|uniref:Uncharacterized protein n=1 Tax=Flavobacterium pisciphilum TaxID=2893755 RepID=A0ABS8MMJ7_9FLAO|nr:hypothetical protein [Flavobacterium sp. F-65]MCC9069991.1 hypothetical protein [Flavobacterium sp. F-65]
MKKNIILFFILVLSANLYGQTGINTRNIDPSAELEIHSSNKGILIPRVALTSSNDMVTIPKAAESLMIYNIANAGIVPHDVVKGFYYWCSEKKEWIALRAPNSWRVSGGDEESTLNTQDIYQMGTVSVGTNTVDDSAIFNVQSDNKGVLFPKVTLKGEQDKSVIKNPTDGLLVYNTGLDPNFNLSGYMYWNTDSWIILSPSKTSKAVISNGLVKDSQMLLSNSYTATVIDDILTVVYSGGNGVFYPKEGKYLASGTVGGDKEIYLELQAGKLESTGMLYFKITGKPGSSVKTSAIKDIKIKFQGKLLGEIDKVGGVTVTEALQFTISNSIDIEDGNEFGENGSILNWSRDNNSVGQYIELPEDGSFVFAFRIYGVTSSTYTTVQQQWCFISAWKELEETALGTSPILSDISEMGLISPRKGSSITYTINLTATGKKGDRVFFKMARGHNNSKEQKFTLTLKNGGPASLPSEKSGARTSMFYFKL